MPLCIKQVIETENWSMNTLGTFWILFIYLSYSMTKVMFSEYNDLSSFEAISKPNDKIVNPCSIFGLSGVGFTKNNCIAIFTHKCLFILNLVFFFFRSHPR